MITVKYDGLKKQLEKIFSPILISLLENRETQIKDGVIIKLEGDLAFKVRIVSENAIEVDFQIKPLIYTSVMNGLVSVHGTVSGMVITKNGMTVKIDGLPDVFVEAL